jgi:hypothetical protein
MGEAAEMDGGKPPPPEAAGENGGGGAGDAGGVGRAASAPSTPVALNDEHASQAAKDLQEDEGLDLEAFLNATFAMGTATPHRGRSSARGRSRAGDKELSEETPESPSSGQPEAPTAPFGRITIPILPKTQGDN